MPDYTYKSESRIMYYDGASGSYISPVISGAFGSDWYKPAEHERTIIKPKEYVCAYCGSDRKNDGVKCQNCGAKKIKEKEEPRQPKITPIRKVTMDDAISRTAEHVAAEDVVHETIDTWKDRLKRKLRL